MGIEDKMMELEKNLKILGEIKEDIVLAAKENNITKVRAAADDYDSVYAKVMKIMSDESSEDCAGAMDSFSSGAKDQSEYLDI